MPLLGGPEGLSLEDSRIPQSARRSSQQFSTLARIAMLSNSNAIPPSDVDTGNDLSAKQKPPADLERRKSQASSALDPHTSHHTSLQLPATTVFRRTQEGQSTGRPAVDAPTSGQGTTLTDTPLPSAPVSPQIYPRGQTSTISSGISTPKIRATTLDIPGLTKSRVSPDGRIAERDVGAKLVIVMVGLPARGKSYIVKKIARYLNWLQHPTRIFNVGDRRRVAAGTGPAIPEKRKGDAALRESVRRMSHSAGKPYGIVEHENLLGAPALAAQILVNDEPQTLTSTPISPLKTRETNTSHAKNPTLLPAPEKLEQNSQFFDPDNKEAQLIREQVAHETLDELLRYVFFEGGSVGILDATNHTQERRASLIKHIRERDSTINVLFLESRCQDRNLLQANMRLKLSGPDYKDKDPVKSLEDFRERVEQYEKKYQSLGDYEEENDIPYCSMIDVGRKMVSYRVNGFLSVQTVTYLMNFNLAPRQIWLTRHGESQDNVDGKIGGDSHLSEDGIRYARALEKFIAKQRIVWEEYQIQKQATTHFPPRPGDTTPPNPEVESQTGEAKNFCVWTSMLRRSIETARFFSEDDYDIKQMKMLDELNAGYMEGMTYEGIKERYHDEYELRKRDKLSYRYPGPGGEGYLDVINRLRKVILEIERMLDHVLIIGHRSITRVLLAYFMGLKQEDISDLDVPLGVLYMLEPRPYGVDFKAFRWNPQTDEFVWQENYQLRRGTEA